MNRLEQQCLDQGMRMNDKRRMLLQVLYEANDHPSVEDLYRRVLQHEANISMATVYRTLNTLVEAGIVSQLDLGDGRTRYEARVDHHDHLLDVTNGSVVEFQSAQLERIIREAAATLGYDLVEYRLEVFGEPARTDNGQTAGNGGKAPSGVAQIRDGVSPMARNRHVRPGAQIAARLDSLYGPRRRR